MVKRLRAWCYLVIVYIVEILLGVFFSTNVVIPHQKEGEKNTLENCCCKEFLLRERRRHWTKLGDHNRLLLLTFLFPQTERNRLTVVGHQHHINIFSWNYGTKVQNTVVVMVWKIILMWQLGSISRLSWDANSILKYLSSAAISSEDHHIFEFVVQDFPNDILNPLQFWMLHCHSLFLQLKIWKCWQALQITLLPKRDNTFPGSRFSGDWWSILCWRLDCSLRSQASLWCRV